MPVGSDGLQLMGLTFNVQVQEEVKMVNIDLKKKTKTQQTMLNARLLKWV